MLKIGTLFSGGLAAVEWAMKYEEFEHEIVFACEWDKYARNSYLAFHGEPTSNFYEDVSDMDGKPYSDTIDLMVWGSPCQDLSLAGKRKGFDGEKSSLFREGARIMSEVMPKAFIFENVKGLLSSNGGADYKEVEKTFRELGYHMAMKVVNAKEQGTAQNRERVFVVGFLDTDEYHNFHFADNVTLSKCLRDYLEDDVDEKYYLSQKMIDGFIHKSTKDDAKMKIQAFHNKDDSHCATLTARYYKCGITDPYIKELNIKKLGFINQDTQASIVFSKDGLCPALCNSNNGYAQGYIQEDLIQVGNIDKQGHNSLWGRVYSPHGVGACLNANGGGAGAKTGLYAIKSATKIGYEIATENDSINFTHPGSETRRGRVGKNVAQTLDCACNQGVIVKDENDISNPLKGKTPYGWHFEQKVYSENSKCTRALTSSEGSGSREKVIQGFRIRRLTPYECFRLMGMNDSDIVLVNSDT